MPSAPQTVTTRGVFDYLLNTAGKPIVGATVNCTLNFNGSSVTSPIVNVGELQQATVTDQNGFWRFLLIPNDTLTPTGTLYTISTPNSTFDISVPSGVADVQSSSILSNVPSVLSPAVTGLTGPVTVTGNETVTGNLTVSGTTTLGSTTTTALTTAAQTVGGDLTISSAFRLLFGAAAAKIIPGATSISHRNNADSADNLLIADAGAVTVRNGLTITAGDGVLTTGRLLISSAAAKILGGVTSLSLRNNADNADNVLVADAGAVTLRNALSIPPTAGGTVTASNYGSTIVKVNEQTPSVAASVLIPATGVLPTGFRHLMVKFRLRADNAVNNNDLWLRFNGDAGANYDIERIAFSGAAGSLTATEALAQAQATIGYVPGTNAPANYFSKGTIWIDDYNDTGSDKEVYVHSTLKIANATGSIFVVTATGTWRTTTAAITTLTLLMNAGNLSGLVTTYGIP